MPTETTAYYSVLSKKKEVIKNHSLYPVVDVVELVLCGEAGTTDGVPELIWLEGFMIYDKFPKDSHFEITIRAGQLTPIAEEADDAT